MTNENVSTGADEHQQKAIELAKKENLLIITGGPGTGKTFTVNHIIDALGLRDSAEGRLALASPTGKAAKRMEELCNLDASTIHRLLEYSPHEHGFTRNEHNPLNLDVVIIDESSMIDIFLMNSLLKAIKDDTKLILVGDKDQLPSVGPGNVLKDMIASENIPVAELKTIHRQDEHSWISLNAHEINLGRMPHLENDSRDFFWTEEDDPEVVRDLIVKLVAYDIPKDFTELTDPLMEIQVLCPQHKSFVGVKQLNQALQDKLNPKEEWTLSAGFFRNYDKVIQTVNNYEKGVMNGTVGQIIGISPNEEGNGKVLHVDFRGKDDFDESQGDIEAQRYLAAVSYLPKDHDQLSLAYAITVHKSQGSEWPVIVMPVHTTNYIMLTRNLLYTAITRASKLVHLVGNYKGLKTAVNRNDVNLRHTYLANSIRNALTHDKTESVDNG